VTIVNAELTFLTVNSIDFVDGDGC